jgi:hypothetical protein
MRITHKVKESSSYADFDHMRPTLIKTYLYHKQHVSYGGATGGDEEGSGNSSAGTYTTLDIQKITILVTQTMTNQETHEKYLNQCD